MNTDDDYLDPVEAGGEARSHGGGHKLTDKKVERWVKSRRDKPVLGRRVYKSDGAGLRVIQVTMNGSFVWYQDLTVLGVKKEFKAGIYPEKLAKVRDKALKAKQLAAAGIDPTAYRNSKLRQDAIASQRVQEKARHTFGYVAMECVNVAEEAEVIGPGTAKARRSRNRRFWEKTAVWATPIGELEIPNVLPVIEAAAKATPDEALKLRSDVKKYLTFAVQRGYIRSSPLLLLQNPAKLVRHLREVRDDEHHHPAILDLALLGQVLRANENANASWQCKLAHRACAFTFQRSGTVCRMRWADLDLDAAVWKIPRKVMKKKKGGNQPKFIVPSKANIENQYFELPLNSQMITPLRGIERQGPFVFTMATDVNRPIAQATVLAHLRDTLGLRDVHVLHSYRSSFSSWAGTQNGPDELPLYADSIVEMCLDHEYQSKVSAAYRRQMNLMAMRRLLQDWGNALEAAEYKARSSMSTYPYKKQP